MKHSRIDYKNDIKVLGRVVSIATENKVAEAEQIFDTTFKYGNSPEGMDQYEINRLLRDAIINLESNMADIDALSGRISTLEDMLDTLEECCQLVQDRLAALEENTPTPTPDKLTFRVTFYPNNGQNNFYQDVQEGNKLVAVTNPTRTDYTFNGWHKDTESGTVWNFNDVVTSNMILVAGWTQNEQPTPQEPIRPSSISISGPNAVQVGNTITLTATITPSNADTDTTITWNSSDASKATVNNGVVTGVAEGDVVITATTANGKTATHNVTVNPAPTQNPQSITITGAKDLKVGTAATVSDKTCTLVATINPAEADQSVTWSSSDNTKATVNNGVVSAVSEGSVTITATSTADPLVSGSVTINITLENTQEPTQDERYKVSWSVDPSGSANVLNAVTENGAYFNPAESSWNNWTATLSAASGYNIQSIVMTMGGTDVTSSYVSGMNISIPKSNINGDVVITITSAASQPDTRYTVTWNVGDHAHVQDINTASALVNGGTVEAGAYFSMGVVPNTGYTLDTTTVTMGGTDITSQCVERTTTTDNVTDEEVEVDAIRILSVTGNVVITTTTTAVAPPTAYHTVSWSFTGDSSHGHMNNPTSQSGGQVLEGSAWTGELTVDSGYLMTITTMNMKNAQNQWVNIIDQYGSMSSDGTRYAINIVNITGDVVIEVAVSKKPIYVTYDTNYNDVLYVNYGTAGTIPDDHRLTAEDFETPSSLVTTDGVHNTQIMEDGDEAATFYTVPGYKITNINVVWDGAAPLWIDPSQHNEFAENVITQISEGTGYNGSFIVQEGIKSSGTVTITVAPEDAVNQDEQTEP